MPKPAASGPDTGEIIALAWADDVSFDQIRLRLGLSEADTIRVMRQELKPSSFRLWRKRVSGRKTKHSKLLRGNVQDNLRGKLRDRGWVDSPDQDD